MYLTWTLGYGSFTFILPGDDLYKVLFIVAQRLAQ